MLAGRGVPIEAPAAPRVTTGFGIQRRLAPMSVDRHLDFADRHAARPGAAEQSTGPRSSRRWREYQSGMPGGTISDFTRIVVTGTPGSSRVLAVDVGADLLHAVERAIDRRDAVEPFDARHAVPARDDQAQRKAVLGRERAPFMAQAMSTSSPRACAGDRLRP